MAKTAETRNGQRKVASPTEPQIRAAMGKVIREVKRHAVARNVKLAVAPEKSWSVPK